jgi:F-type H+-transporting ATPase subunit epsilon
VAETQGSGKLKCVVVTPEATVLEAPADFVALPAADGEVGVLPQRLQLAARLGFGVLRIKDGATVTRLFVDGGFAQVRDNVVTLMTTFAKDPADLKADEIEKQLAATQQETAVDLADSAKRLRRVSSLKAQLRLLGK